MLRNWIAATAITASLAASTASHAQKSSELVRKVAPQFVREDLTGRKIDLKQYRGKVVLLNFWATWCASCRVELPKFAAWQGKYRGAGLRIVAVSMDDSSAPVHRVLRKMHLDFPVVMGDAQLGETYGGVLGLPVTFLIDRDGKIAAETEGDADLTALESQVQQLLAKQ